MRELLSHLPEALSFARQVRHQSKEASLLLAVRAEEQVLGVVGYRIQ